MKFFQTMMLAVFLCLSCSDSYKFNGESNQQISIEGIYYEIYDYSPEEIYLFGMLNSKIEGCASSNDPSSYCYFNDHFWVINDDVCISLKNLGACHLSGYSWIIDNKIVPSFENPHNIGYGEHLVKLVLVDVFGDSVSDSIYIQVNDPNEQIGDGDD